MQSLLYGCLAALTLCLGTIRASDEILCNSPGERFVGILWYRCEADNSITVVGCKADTGEQAKIGEYLTTEKFVFKCEKRDDRYVQLVPRKCVVGGQQLRAGEKVSIDNFYYECKKLKSLLYTEIAGCANEEGHLVKFGDKYRKGDFRYTCTVVDEDIVEKPISCVIDDQEISAGKVYVRDGIYYRCSRNDATGDVQLVAEGCVDSKKKRHKIGSNFVDNSFEYKCSSVDTKDGTVLYMEIMGCYGIDDNGEQKLRQFEESWYQFHPTDAKFKYKVMCSGDKDYATLTPTKCVVDRRGKPLEIDVGCGTAYDTTSAFICEKDEEGDVQIELRSVDNGDTMEAVYKKYGVKQC